MLKPLGSNLIPSDFVSGKLNGRDVLIIVRGNNLEKPLVIYWADILASLPSGVTFQTDGVNNTVQNLLNLIEGTNITLTPDGSGGVTIDATGGGGTYTVNNGLTESPSGNFRLGGALIQTTVITSTGFPLNIISNVSGNALSVINNSAVLGAIGVRGEGYYGIFGSGTQAGVRGISVNSIGVMGLSTNGVGGTFESTNAWGLEARSDAIGMEGAKISNNSSVNNAIEKVLRLTKQAPAPANGVGASLEYYISSSLIATYFSNSISSIWTDVTHASRTSQLEIRGVNNAVTARLLALTGAGQLILDKYGINTFGGTPTYALGVDATGNVVEFTPSGGSSPLTTKGDLYTYSTLDTRLPVGTNGFFLQANSATATGLEYTDTLANGTKATTQPVADNSTKIATTAYVTTAIKTFSPYQRQTFWNRNTGGANTIIYVAANDVLYVANNSLGNVYCYNCVTGALVANIPVAAVIGLFYYPVTGTVYASNTSNGACVRISTAATPTNLGTVTLVVQWSTTGVEYSATKGFTTTPSSVEVFNPTTNLSITNIAVANPVGCCLNTNGASVQNDRLIVTGSAGITIINATTNAITAAATSVGGAISVSPTAGARRIIYIASQDIYVVCDSVFSRLCWLTPSTATTFTASYFTYSLNRCWSLEYDSTNQVILVVGTNTTVGSITIASPVILWIIDALTRVCLRTIVTNSNCLSASYLDCYVQIKTPGIAIVSAFGSNMSTEIIYA